MAKRRASSRRDIEQIRMALAWFDANQWAALKRVALDADKLDDTYEEWRCNAENVERRLRQSGFDVIRASINVDALVAWCRSRNKPIDGTSRSEYAAELAAEGHNESV